MCAFVSEMGHRYFRFRCKPQRGKITILVVQGGVAIIQRPQRPGVDTNDSVYTL